MGTCWYQIVAIHQSHGASKSVMMLNHLLLCRSTWNPPKLINSSQHGQFQHLLLTHPPLLSFVSSIPKNHRGKSPPGTGGKSQRQRLVPGGPEDVGAAGLVAGLVTHRGLGSKARVGESWRELARVGDVANKRHPTIAVRWSGYWPKCSLEKGKSGGSLGGKHRGFNLHRPSKPKASV